MANDNTKGIKPATEQAEIKKLAKELGTNNPTGIGGFQDHPELINVGGRKKNVKRVSWWYDVFGQMRAEDVKTWNNSKPITVTLADGEEISKEWKCGFSEVAYNTFIRARSSLKDTKEVTDRTEGKAPQEIKHVGEIENILDIPEGVYDAIKRGFRQAIKEHKPGTTDPKVSKLKQLPSSDNYNYRK